MGARNVIDFRDSFGFRASDTSLLIHQHIQEILLNSPK
jgi:hypothetical protein